MLSNNLPEHSETEYGYKDYRHMALFDLFTLDGTLVDHPQHYRLKDANDQNHNAKNRQANQQRGVLHFTHCSFPSYEYKHGPVPAKRAANGGGGNGQLAEVGAEELQVS